MNLTDLQIQLRSIENHISELQVEIEKMKPQPEAEKKTDFERITKLAKIHPLDNDVLAKEDPSIKKMYITCLSYVALAAEENQYEKLLYLCRIAQGMNVDYSAEEIMKMGMELDWEYLENLCKELKELRYSFLTDSMILANMTGEAAEAMCSIIADMAKILACDKEELYVMAFVAKAVLLGNMDILHSLPTPTNRWMGMFRQYIPLSWIESQRKYCGKCLSKSINNRYSLPWSLYQALVTRRFKAGSVVKYEDELVIGGDISITAACDGIVFFVEDEKRNFTTGKTDIYISAYVCSYFDDYAEFCEWYKKK